MAESRASLDVREAKTRITCRVPDSGEYYVFPSKAAPDWNYTWHGDSVHSVPGTCGKALHKGEMRNVFMPRCNARVFAKRAGVRQTQHFPYMLRAFRKTVEGWCGGLVGAAEDKHEPNAESPGLLVLLCAASSHTTAQDQPDAKKLRYDTGEKQNHKCVIQEECPKLLTLLPETLVLILEKCGSTTLSLIDQACKALSTPRLPLSLIQRAVQKKLASEYPSTSLNVKSWPAHLAQIEQAHRAGSSWKDPTAEVNAY